MSPYTVLATKALSSNTGKAKEKNVNLAADSKEKGSISKFYPLNSNRENNVWC